MNDLSKIPFGLRESDQQYVDVFDVNNGKQCGCICPSCKTPLQARQGDINKWHFAHLSRGTSSLTQNECEYSFWVSVLSMAKEILRKGGELSVPSYTKFLGHDEIFITDQKIVQLSNTEIESNQFDVYCNFGKYAIGIYFTSPEKQLQEIHAIDKKIGILEISISSAMEMFFSKTRNSDYKGILNAIILQGISNKQWIYHPKIEYYKARYGARITEKPPYDIDTVLGGIPHVKTSCYTCNRCKIKWRGINKCPDCHNRANRSTLST